MQIMLRCTPAPSGGDHAGLLHAFIKYAFVLSLHTVGIQSSKLHIDLHGLISP